MFTVIFGKHVDVCVNKSVNNASSTEDVLEEIVKILTFADTTI